MERTEIIAFLKEKDDFFRKVNFDAYTSEELRKIKSRWEDVPQKKSGNLNPKADSDLQKG